MTAISNDVAPAPAPQAPPTDRPGGISWLNVKWDPGLFGGDRQVFVARGDGPITAVTVGPALPGRAMRVASNRFEEAAGHEFADFAGEQLRGLGFTSNVSADYFNSFVSEDIDGGKVALGFTLDGRDVHYIGSTREMPEAVLELLKGARQLRGTM